MSLFVPLHFCCLSSLLLVHIFHAMKWCQLPSSTAHPLSLLLLFFSQQRGHGWLLFSVYVLPPAHYSYLCAGRIWDWNLVGKQSGWPHGGHPSFTPQPHGQVLACARYATHPIQKTGTSAVLRPLAPDDIKAWDKGQPVMEMLAAHMCRMRHGAICSWHLQQLMSWTPTAICKGEGTQHWTVEDTDRRLTLIQPQSDMSRSQHKSWLPSFWKF